MVSKLTICNLALAQLGQAPITALTQDNERARKLDLFYEPVRDEVLRTHNWGFAGAESPLTYVGESNTKPGEFLYQYPGQALFIRRVFDIKAPHESLAFEEFFDEDHQMRVLQIPAAQAVAQYTRRITDETLFDPAFVKTFSLALACDVAVTLTADVQLVGLLMNKYQLSLEEARRSNMTEKFQILGQKDAFTEVR